MTSVHLTALAGRIASPGFGRARVFDAMHHGVLSCPAEASLAAVGRMMASYRVHAVLVMGTDAAGGERAAWAEVSDMDLIRGRLAQAADEGTALSAGDVAGSEVVTVTEDETLERAAQLLVEHDVSHLVVTAGEKGRPTGILSSLDVADAIAWEEEPARP